MRILQIAHRALPHEVGGTEAYMAAVGKALTARGHECLVLAGTDEGAPEPRLLTNRCDGVWLSRYAGDLSGWHRGHWTRSFDPGAARLFREFLAFARPDLVHLHHWMRLTDNLVAVCAGEGIPVVVSIHDLWISCPRGMRFTRDGAFCTEPSSPAACLNCVERTPWQDDAEIASAIDIRVRTLARELELAACLVVPSEAQKQLLCRTMGAVFDRARVLPHGSLVEWPSPTRDPTAGFPNRPLQIGYWGNLWPLKGVHLLLEAARRLAEPDRVAIHLYGGDAPPWYLEELQAAATGLQVRFYGRYVPSDLAGLDLDLAVFPSLAHESFGLVLDEAFRAGLPVIVSDRGALAERAGSAGLIFSAGDTAGLAARIQEILDRPELLGVMRSAIPVSPSPAMEVHVEALERLYQEATMVSRTPGSAETHAAVDDKRLEQALRGLAVRDAELDRLQERVSGAETEAARLREMLTRAETETTELREQTARLRELADSGRD
ncbi:MAG: glycosyltransferase [Candidatus Methylomirabilis sp.]|nr:glycosyltransferase [Candidatus Methylomirabilis sp.]